jgi:predicted DCC family thiol-disulfide oxidoreductase YuxK
MTDSPAQASVDAQDAEEAQGAHLVLYDGVCGLCSRLLQFLLTHDHRAVFNFASLQSATGTAIVERCGGDPHELTSFYVLANYRTPASRFFTKSRAALFVAGELGWPWKVARVAGILPSALLDHVYDLVARTRYRIFGRYEQCLVPRPEYRRRFVD